MTLAPPASTHPVTPQVGDLSRASELLRALSAPHRLAIVLALAQSPRCVHELVDALGISQSLASQHLRVLRTTGLVAGRRRGKETLYSLADDHVAHIARDAVAHCAETLVVRRSPGAPWPAHATGAPGTGTERGNGGSRS